MDRQTERPIGGDDRGRTLTTADIAGSNRLQAGQEPQAAEPTPTAAPAGATATQGRQGADERTPLFPTNEAQGLHSRWDGIQAGFVDDPRRTVEQADALVAEVMKRLAEVFAEERSKLEKQWERGADVSTEELRIALQRYRSFFGRLLSL